MKYHRNPSGLIALHRAVDERAVRPITEDIAEDMRRYVPVDQGDLKGTIRTEYPAEGHGQVWFGDVHGEHGDEVVDYHLYVEDGTSRMAAQPYARPAAYQPRSL